MAKAVSGAKTKRQLGLERKYELVAFLTGFSLLVLEITGGRLIAPYFGSSIYIWTAVIGVILGALAAGTVIGGQRADTGQPLVIIRNTALFAAITVAVMGIVQQPILASLASANLDLRLSATLAALLLFALPSYLIGVVGPNLAKLNVTSLEVAGRSVGRIEAASTIGSIAGTFAAGYFLLGWFGSRSVVFGVATLLLIVALLIGAKPRKAPGALVWVGAAVVALGLASSNYNASGVLADIDTSYARYTVFEAYLGVTPVRALATDGLAYQSGISLTNPDQPVFPYIKNFYDITLDRNPQSVLVIGGGSFTFPTILNRADGPAALRTVDVVEIDPALTDIARRYFFYEPSSLVNVINQDGRAFLNRSNNQYDIVFMDAFSSLSPPFQLTTTEAVARIADALTARGTAVVNIIGNYDSGNGEYLRSVVATYKTQFKNVDVYQSDPALALSSRQNFIVVASNQQASLNDVLGSQPLSVNNGGLVLTDDFAPIERLTY